ncbi:hypothetical protein D8S78_10655 [Natrialba swarupiae]|nr:hypothetical protein [Natrialba swarupiae]
MSQRPTRSGQWRRNGNGNGNGNGDDEAEDEAAETDETEPPEPDFVVGSSAEADYETLQDAYDSLDSGDVIGIESGKYTVQPDVEYADIEGEFLTKTYTYVGESDEDTVIEIVMPEARSFTVRGRFTSCWAMARRGSGTRPSRSPTRSSTPVSSRTTSTTRTSRTSTRTKRGRPTRSQ